MDDEQIIKDFEIIRALYHGNHLNHADFERANDVLNSLSFSLEQRIKR